MQVGNISFNTNDIDKAKDLLKKYGDKKLSEIISIIAKDNNPLSEFEKLNGKFEIQRKKVESALEDGDNLRAKYFRPMI
jgi:hypothetical protein